MNYKLLVMNGKIIRISVEIVDAQSENATQKDTLLREQGCSLSQAERISRYFSTLSFGESSPEGWITRPFQEDEQKVQKKSFQEWISVLS